MLAESDDGDERHSVPDVRADDIDRRGPVLPADAEPRVCGHAFDRQAGARLQRQDGVNRHGSADGAKLTTGTSYADLDSASGIVGEVNVRLLRNRGNDGPAADRLSRGRRGAEEVRTCRRHGANILESKRCEVTREFTWTAGDRNASGVTLIELMTVVVVIGILAAIAVPSYRSYLLRANRTDAKRALLQVQAAEEKYYLSGQRYTTERD